MTCGGICKCSPLMPALVLAFFTFPGSAQSDEHYVPTDYPSIQAAVDAVPDGDTIIVLPDAFNVPPGPYAGFRYHGFAGTVRSYAGPLHTTIQGTVNFRDGETISSVLDGFTITGATELIVFASASESGRVYNCVLDGGSSSGVRVYSNGTAILENLIIRNCGSGIYVRQSSNTLIRECWITGCTSAGIRVIDTAVPTIQRCRLENNDIGIVSDEGAEPVVHNCIILDSVDEGIEAYTSGTTTVLNCVVARSGSYGMAVDNGVLDVDNCVISNNADCGVKIWSPGSASVRYTCFYANSGGNVCGGTPAGTCIYSNPLFTSADDFHLQASSPCIDSGDPAYQDSYMPPGLNGARSDMGAYGGPYNGWPDYAPFERGVDIDKLYYFAAGGRHLLYFNDADDDGFHDPGEALFLDDDEPGVTEDNTDLSCWFAAACNAIYHREHDVDYPSGLWNGTAAAPVIDPWTGDSWYPDGGGSARTFDDGGFPHWGLSYLGYGHDGPITTSSEFGTNAWQTNPITWALNMINDGKPVLITLWSGRLPEGVLPGWRSQNREDYYHAITIWDIDTGGQQMTITDSDDQLAGPRIVDYSYVAADWQVHSLYGGEIAHVNYATSLSDAILHPVTITSSPILVEFLADDVSYHAPHTFNWLEGSNHTVEMPSIYPVAEGERCSFDAWSDGAQDPLRMIVVSGEASYVALFQREFQLNVATDPAGVVTIPGAGWYQAGQGVVLTAPDTAGDMSFLRWEVDGNPVDPVDQNPIDVFMDAPHSAVAFYGSSVSAWNDGPVCEGESVQLHAGPDGMDTYAWSGPGGYASSQQHPLVENPAPGDYCVTVTDGGVPLGSACTTVLVHALPSPPADVTAMPPMIDAPGQAVILSAVVAPGEVADWYDSGCGQGPIGSGSMLEVHPLATTTYYARARNLATGCESESCGSVTVTVLASGPVAYYPLDGNAEDASGYGNHGEAFGDVDFSTADRFEDPAHAARFDGDGDGILMPSSEAYQPTDVLTVSCWIYTEGLNPGQAESHLVNDANREPARGYYLALTSGLKARFWISQAGVGQSIDSDVTLTADNWHHVVGVYDGESLLVYVDAEPKSASVGSDAINYLTGLPLRLGYHAIGSQEFYRGVLDDVAVYDRALSQAEVEALFHAGGWPPSAAWTDASDAIPGDTGTGYGAAWGDFDNDGDDDLYVTYHGPNKLYENNGDGSFSDATVPPLDHDGYGHGAAWGDYDLDGDLDLYLGNGGSQANVLFRNDTHPEGDPVFVDVTAGPLGNEFSAETVSWVDYDRDGDLDLYIVNTYNYSNKLLRNEHMQGSDEFTDVTAPPMDNLRYGYGQDWGDYDNDGDPDLYIGNLRYVTISGLNALLRNDGGGNFTDVTEPPLDCDRATRGVIWGDYNNDGWLDLYITNSYEDINLLAKNLGNGDFLEVAADPLADPGFSYGAAWGDYDNDGDLDLFVANIIGTNRLFRNDGDDVFTDVTVPPLDHADGNDLAATWCDYDRDGDIDLYVVNNIGESKLIRNELDSPNHWLHVDLRNLHYPPDAINASAIGTRVQLYASGVCQTREITGGGGYLSQSSPMVEFGLGLATIVDSLHIHWPVGDPDVFYNLPVDRIMVIHPTVAVDPADEGASPFALYQCAPNPFNPTTMISFDLSEPCRTSLRVYDIEGRLVRSLLAACDLERGRYRYAWDGKDDLSRSLPSGIYLCRLYAGQHVGTTKMTLLK